jgi:hypothetical protein
MSDPAHALIDWLGEAELRELAERLSPYLLGAGAPAPPVYTAATLAAELAITPRAVRAAISRGELQGAKRGAGWLITRDAAMAWATPSSASPRRGVQRRRIAAARERPASAALERMRTDA